MTIARMMIAEGAKACSKARETEAIVRNINDITIVVEYDIRTKKKKAPGSRRRLVMKYMTRLKVIALRITYG